MGAPLSKRVDSGQKGVPWQDRGGLSEPERLQSVPINRIEDNLTVLFEYSFDSH